MLVSSVIHVIYPKNVLRPGVPMASGRKKRIMIACVTFETVKVTDPIEYYEINKAHIIHYVRDPHLEDNIYNSFYRRVEEIISGSQRTVEIVEHNEKVNDFSTMLRTVLKIIQDEKANEDEDCEIYVNISSGTSEYAAASAIASMMVPGTIPFSVGSQSYTVKTEDIKKTYFVDDKPVGLTASTYEPRTLPSYTIDLPEEYLVRGLRILDEKNGRRESTTSGMMIQAIKEKGQWIRDTDTDDPDKKAKQRQTEAVYYQRDFITKWVKNGWVVKEELRNKYVLTPEGKNIIDTFYTNE